jgi:hypothetical protein
MIDCYYPNIRVFAAFVPLIRSRARSTLMTSRRLKPLKPTWQRVCLADCSPDRRDAILALISHQTLLRRSRIISTVKVLHASMVVVTS